MLSYIVAIARTYTVPIGMDPVIRETNVESLTGIGKAGLRRVARRAGIERQAAKFFDEARKSLCLFLKEGLWFILIFVRHARRQTVRVEDLQQGLKRSHGMTLYGYNEPKPYFANASTTTNIRVLRVGDRFRELDDDEKKCIAVLTVTNINLDEKGEPYTVDIAESDEPWFYAYALQNVIRRKPRRKAQKKTIGAAARKSALRTKQTQKPKQKSRARPGAKARREIRRYQRSTDLLLRVKPFQTVVREIAGLIKSNVRFEPKALVALQDAAEAHLIKLFRITLLNARHDGRVTVMACDFELERERNELF